MTKEFLCDKLVLYIDKSGDEESKQAEVFQRTLHDAVRSETETW